MGEIVQMAPQPARVTEFYQTARDALLAASRPEQLIDLRNKADAMAEYARRSRDGELIGYAVEIRTRAERTLGQIMAAAREAGELAKAGRKPKSGAPGTQLTLTDQGIDKRLADRARKAERMDEAEFEVWIRAKVRSAIAVIENDREFITAEKAERNEQKRRARAEREERLGATLAALPEKKYGVIYADPEWQFETWSEDGKDRAPENHYPTSVLDEIKKRDVPSIAADHCVLFLWATVPMLPQALEVMAAWGFRYVTNVVAKKDRTGTGYWFRNQHEHLLVGVRGIVPAPAMGTQWGSVIEFNVREHSQKPDVVYTMIEDYFPSLPKIELNARGPAREGWDAWGNEAVA